MSSNQYDQLFESFTFKSGVSIDNRIVMAPMTSESSFENGMVTTDELNYFARHSKSAGMIITSCAQFLENGRFSGSLGVSSDTQIEGLRKLANTVKKDGSKAILQIFHVGRMGSAATLKGEQPVSASTVPSNRPAAEIPRALSDEEVRDAVTAFGESVRRAIQAGFDGIEIHGANTYLIQQFFSPHSNRREDQWGGNIEKRMTFPMEIIKITEKMVEQYAETPFVIGYRLSPEELENPGITLSDTLKLMQKISETKVDYIHVSLGDYKKTSIRDTASKTPVLKLIKEHLGDAIPLIGVGKVLHPDDALDMMEMGIPLVAIGRALIMEPDWLEKVRTDRLDEIRTEISLKKLDDLVLPAKMVEYIQSPAGWLNIKEQPKGGSRFKELTM